MGCGPAGKEPLVPLHVIHPVGGHLATGEGGEVMVADLSAFLAKATPLTIEVPEHLLLLRIDAHHRGLAVIILFSQPLDVLELGILVLRLLEGDGLAHLSSGEALGLEKPGHIILGHGIPEEGLHSRGNAFPGHAHPSYRLIHWVAGGA